MILLEKQVWRQLECCLIVAAERVWELLKPLHAIQINPTGIIHVMIFFYVSYIGI